MIFVVSCFQYKCLINDNNWVVCLLKIAKFNNKQQITTALNYSFTMHTVIKHSKQ